MSGRRQGNTLPTSLPQLQNLIKRDASLYKEEFLQQLRHYESELKIFQLNPSTASSEGGKQFADTVMFISQVCVHMNRRMCLMITIQ